MPRPVAKRSRLTTQTSGTLKTQSDRQEGSRKDIEHPDSSRSPASDAVGISRLVPSAHTSELIQQLRNQTPLSKTNELAIESSPSGEHGATGSRPPTRARGYSSTLSLVGRKGDISSKIPGTPAFESSVLSNFRRRPRQASILQMMQDESGSSDFDDEDFLGGLSPEDESTPLNLSKGKPLVIRQAMPSSPINSSLLSSKKSAKRRLSVTEPQAPQSPLQIAPRSPISNDQGQEQHPLVDLPLLLKSPPALNENMIPPMSSPLPETTNIDSVIGSKQQPLSANHKTAEPKVSDKKTHLSTAVIQDKFLPQRRQRMRMRHNAASFEVLDNSDEDSILSTASDDDELSYLPARKPSQTQRKQTSKLPKVLQVPEELPRGTKASRGKRSGGARRATATGLKRDERLTTAKHGSHEITSVNKENELTDMSSPLSSALDTDELDSDFEALPAINFLSEELRLQALKFAEVDKW